MAAGKTSMAERVSRAVCQSLSDLRFRIDSQNKLIRCCLALLSGVLAAMAFQPISWIFVLPVALPILIWLVHGGCSKRSAFLFGWMFGLGFFAVGLYWIGHAFMVHEHRHGFLAIPAVFGLAAALGLYIGTAAVIYKTLIAENVISGGSVLLFSSLWTLAEWVRGWAFTGFPWNLVGTAWTVSVEMMQIAAFGGVYLLSFLTVFCSALIAVLAADGAKPQDRLLGALVPGLIVGCLVFALGSLRIENSSPTFVEDVRLRLVQPNIPQKEKWAPHLRAQHVSRQLAMSLEPRPEGEPPTHIIWAETAVPYVLSGSSELVSLLARAAPSEGALITGAVRTETDPRADEPTTRYWNSLFVVGPERLVLANYDKAHLVPFGEYMPFSDYLPVEKMTFGAGNFSAGPARQTLLIRGLPPVSMLICYEIIFPGRVIADSGPKPDWILNATNDAWYGLSPGPYQHFASAIVRAVEEGLPVVRVANTGISAVIDGYGQVGAQLPLGAEGVLDARLPLPLAPTVFSTWGNTPTIIILLLLCAGSGWNLRQSGPSRDSGAGTGILQDNGSKSSLAFF